MRPIQQFFRLIHINWVLLKHGLDEVILATHLFRPLRFIIFFFPWYWLSSSRKQPRGVRIRQALEDLGPIFVKFGQILSTRRDLLPNDIVDELSKLQDNVPSFSPDKARKIVEQALNGTLEEVFAEFEYEPMASASIAQVHGAKLKTGESVVVKITRPAIEKVIARDVGLMYVVAGLAERYWSEGKRLRPKEVVHEFERTIFDELDFQKEAANASQLRRNFKDSELLYVPEVYWDYTRRNVMVMERISGIPIGDIEALKAQNTNMKVLAERGVEIFFTQVFRDNFFHADMHPGNIFVSTENPDQPQYIAVDFGIVGALSKQDQRYLAENFIAFFNRDYRRVAELHVESGWVPSDTRVEEFESAIRSVCEPIFEKPLKDISFGHLLLRLFQTARRFNMEVQPQLVLLQKTLLNIEGLGRQLYPDLDLWVTAKPFLEDWMKQQVGFASVFSKIKQNLPFWIEQLPDIPDTLHDAIVHVSKTQEELKQQRHELVKLRHEMRQQQHTSVANTIGGVALLSGVMLFIFQPVPMPSTMLISGIIGGVGLGYLVAKIWRR